MIGRLIGNYKILEKIGEGGMGAVWRGIDIMLDREVAIKMLRPELASNAQTVERFRAEAVTLARLNHPNIATLYAFLRQGNDFFMVMEYVRGETLSHAISRLGAMPCAEASRWFCQALEGVHHAHEMGIIHRDIKPANIMLTPGGSIKVMDFGIARALSASRMTRTGHLIGTLEYMAPELIQGQGGDVRSDIYALGMLFYEMLTGRLPFESSSDYALMRAQVEAAPPPPRCFAPHLPVAVEQALMRALAKRPQARFQTAAEFRALLRKAVPLNDSAQSQARLNNGAAAPAAAPLASAPLVGGLKELRLASDGGITPLAASTAPRPPADQTGQMPPSVAPHLKTTRLANGNRAQPAGPPAGAQAAAAQAAGLPFLLPANGAAQAASVRHGKPGFAGILEKLGWRHYAGFGALLLAILSAPFLLVSKNDPRSVSQPATAAPSQPAQRSNTTPAPANGSQATPAPSSPVNDPVLPPAASGGVVSTSTTPATPRRGRGRRSTPPSAGETKPPAKEAGNDGAKKDEGGRKREDKEDEGGRKEEKKGGIFRKLKKLNPFGRGDKKKD